MYGFHANFVFFGDTFGALFFAHIRSASMVGIHMLSHAEMTTEWPVPLLNGEQMSNKVRVEHQPENGLNYHRS